MMSHLNGLNLTLPYFASKENQTLYVVIPAVSPMLFKQSHNDIVNFSTEEEILPDFRCKICSVRISNYSEFQAHQQDHKKIEEDGLKKSHFLVADRVQLLRNSNCGLELDLSENFRNNEMFDPLKHSSHLKTFQNTNGVHDKIFPSDISSNRLPEGYKRLLSSSETVVSLNNSVCCLNNSKMPACSKLEKTLGIKNGMLETEFKTYNSSKLPFIQKLNKCDEYALTSQFSNPIDANLSHIIDNSSSKSTLNNKNSSVSNQILSSIISGEIIEGPANKIPAAESSASNVTLTLTYTGLKQLSIPHKKKQNVQAMKPLITQCTNSKESESEIIEERRNQTVNEFNVSSRFHSLANRSNDSRNNYFEKDVSIPDNTRGETLAYNESRPSSMIPLQSMYVSDHRPLILRPLSNAKERGKLPVKKVLEYKESFLNGISNETLSEKGIHPMVDKSDDIVSTSQTFGNINSSVITTCSEYETHAEKANTDETVKCDDSSPLKTSSLQSAEMSDHDVYILEPSTNAKEKPMRCFYCRKNFKSSDEMRRHLLLHKESKSVFCTECNLFFTRISTFRSHLLIFHCQAKEVKKCPYCEYRCFRTSNLENHLVKMHFKYKCTLCRKRFATPKELYNHLEKKHLRLRSKPNSHEKICFFK